MDLSQIRIRHRKDRRQPGKRTDMHRTHRRTAPVQETRHKSQPKTDPHRKLADIRSGSLLHEIPHFVWLHCGRVGEETHLCLTKGWRGLGEDGIRGPRFRLSIAMKSASYGMTGGGSIMGLSGGGNDEAGGGCAGEEVASGDPEDAEDEIRSLPLALRADLDSDVEVLLLRAELLLLGALRLLPLSASIYILPINVLFLPIISKPSRKRTKNLLIDSQHIRRLVYFHFQQIVIPCSNCAVLSAILIGSPSDMDRSTRATNQEDAVLSKSPGTTVQLYLSSWWAIFQTVHAVPRRNIQTYYPVASEGYPYTGHRVERLPTPSAEVFRNTCDHESIQIFLRLAFAMASGGTRSSKRLTKRKND
ncbi:hypothetical protein FB45DRAFT_1150022 [Roridomyces roridus]|uniref:Uncharacterized protein n=1 Tax=Roridomyces roridus TaxID=1738132 RepID=A0AAD7AZJ4_9AGAR|nr:hypothetical protein FB45DRAFT_1150022 [Roridomyces roridus]